MKNELMTPFALAAGKVRHLTNIDFGNMSGETRPTMPPSTVLRKPPAPAAARDIPPLENGDRLTRAEFERRYDAMPELKKAELIEGVVYVPSPIRFERHGKQTRHIATWLGHYEAATPHTEGGDNSTVRLDLDNEPQPDSFLRIMPKAGGQSSTSEDDYVEGVPELVAEVASSSASYDLHDKLKVYRRSGVLEYIVWRVLDGAVDWFVLEEGEYKRLEPDAAGVYQSRVFPGLWLDAPVLLGRDLARVLAVLDEGLRSPEHAAFVEKLRAAAKVEMDGSRAAG
jgi:Uma2 family endonuclease